jgi:hypothetical protein
VFSFSESILWLTLYERLTAQVRHPRNEESLILSARVKVERRPFDDDLVFPGIRLDGLKQNWHVLCGRIGDDGNVGNAVGLHDSYHLAANREKLTLEESLAPVIIVKHVPYAENDLLAIQRWRLWKGATANRAKCQQKG